MCLHQINKHRKEASMHLRQYCSLTEEPCISANPVVQHRPLPRRHNFDLALSCNLFFTGLSWTGNATNQKKNGLYNDICRHFKNFQWSSTGINVKTPKFRLARCIGHKLQTNNAKNSRDISNAQEKSWLTVIKFFLIGRNYDVMTLVCH